MLDELLQLERPLVWLDVETHDKCPPERAYIVELGLIVFYPKNHPRHHLSPYRYQTFIKPPKPITPAATGVHNITNDMVEQAPMFYQLAPSLVRGFEGVDFGGYNVNFDLRALSAEFQRIPNITWDYSKAKIIDPLRIWQIVMPRNLANAVREFAGREPTNSHRALADTQDVIDTFIGQLQRFTNLPRSVDALHDLCFEDKFLDKDRKFGWNGDVPIICFGKHSGKPLREVPTGYLKWIAGDGDFAPDTKKIAEDALKGRYPSKRPLLQDQPATAAAPPTTQHRSE